MKRATSAASLLVAAIAAAAVVVAVPAAAAAGSPTCRPGAVLTLVGLDTAGGTALLALPGADGATSHLVAWTLGAARASAYPVTAAERPLFGGSVGPGPIFRFARCGDDCLQPVRFRAGAWEPLGEALTAPAATTVHATYDRAGAAWLVLHAPGTEPGQVRARAFELVGGEWQPRGSLAIVGTMAPGAAPAPWFTSGVVSGSALFSTVGEPRLWLAGLPAGAEPAGTQIIAFHRQTAALITADGAVYRTPDAGRSWHRVTWTPWRTGTAEPWVRGRDYTVDLPLGLPEGQLPLAWFDHRLPDVPEQLLLTAMGPGGAWRQVASVPAELPTSAGEPLPVTHVFHHAGRGDADTATTADTAGAWTLLYGCVTSDGRPVLVSRRVAEGSSGAPRLIPLDDKSLHR